MQLHWWFQEQKEGLSLVTDNLQICIGLPVCPAQGRPEPVPCTLIIWVILPENESYMEKLFKVSLLKKTQNPSLIMREANRQVWYPMDCNPPGSSVHRILQARILEWVTLSFSRGSSPPRDQTWISCFACRLFTVRATRKPLWGYALPVFGCFSVLYKITSLWNVEAWKYQD